MKGNSKMEKWNKEEGVWLKKGDNGEWFGAASVWIDCTSADSHCNSPYFAAEFSWTFDKAELDWYAEASKGYVFENRAELEESAAWHKLLSGDFTDENIVKEIGWFAEEYAAKNAIDIFIANEQR